MPLKQYLKILELEESADLAKLNEHYRYKIKQFHPDLFADNPARQKEADEKTKELNLAYSELKRILPKAPSKKSAQKNTENEDATDIMSSSKLDIFGSIANMFDKLIKKLDYQNIVMRESLDKNTKKDPEVKSEFREVLKNKMNTSHQKKMPVNSYSKIYKDLQKRRALYGNRQKDGANEKGVVSPVSAVQGIRGNRIQ